MKTDDWVLLAGAAAIAWILTRRPGATIAAAPTTATRPRTGTVTAGPLTPGAYRPSPYEAGQQLLSAWTQRPGEPTLADWYGY